MITGQPCHIGCLEYSCLKLLDEPLDGVDLVDHLAVVFRELVDLLAQALECLEYLIEGDVVGPREVLLGRLECGCWRPGRWSSLTED